jgi:hypothetical protein
MSQDALDLLLSGVKDQGQRKQITSAYYAFANGDSETFAVQFAVLLRAHAVSLKLLPARLEKALSAETRKLGDMVIAHQRSVERMVALVNKNREEDRGGEEQTDFERLRTVIAEQFAEHIETVKVEREAIVSAVTANGRLLGKMDVSGIRCGLILSYIAGLMTIPVFQHLISWVCLILH